MRPAITLNIGPLNNQATELESRVTSVVGKRGLISMKLQRMCDDKTEQGKFMRDLYQKDDVNLIKIVLSELSEKST